MINATRHPLLSYNFPSKFTSQGHPLLTIPVEIFARIFYQWIHLPQAGEQEFLLK